MEQAGLARLMAREMQAAREIHLHLEAICQKQAALAVLVTVMAVPAEVAAAAMVMLGLQAQAVRAELTVRPERLVLVVQDRVFILEHYHYLL